MTQLILTHANFLQSGISEVLESIKTLKTTLQKRREYKNTLNTLRSMSNKELSDIGISRGDIEAVARGVDVRSAA